MTSNGNPQQALPPNFGFEPQNLLHEMGSFFLPQSPNQNIEVLTTPSLLNSSPCNQAKKDGNTKIKTAHGVRDRRVRLSMGIAREFFDLQDMLGFDRASKTIGWLLARSKFAIQELALDKKSLGYKSQDGPSFNTSKQEIEKASVEMRQDNVVVREKRVRARARARARTREKVSTNLLDGYNVITSQDSSTLLVGCSASNYLQDHPIAPIGDQNSSWAGHFPNSYAGINPEATISSVSGWNIFTSPTGYIS